VRSTDDTAKAVKVFRPATKTGDFAHNLCNQVWSGFWSHDGQAGLLIDSAVRLSTDNALVLTGVANFRVVGEMMSREPKDGCHATVTVVVEKCWKTANKR
jgi:hypothetical protein